MHLVFISKVYYLGMPLRGALSMRRDALPRKEAEQPIRAAIEADGNVNYQICQRNSCCLPRLRFHFERALTFYLLKANLSATLSLLSQTQRQTRHHCKYFLLLFVLQRLMDPFRWKIGIRNRQNVDGTASQGSA